MLKNKIRLPIFLILLQLIFSLQSCERKVNEVKQDTIDKTVEINNYIKQGEIYFEKQKYDSSYYFFNKAKLLCDPKINTKKFIYTISNLATIQQNQGDYTGSETTLMETFPLIEKTKNPKYKWSIYTVLGINYMNTLDNENALYYFEKSLKLNIDNKRKNDSKNNIALIYIEKKEFKRALKIFKNLAIEKEIIKHLKEYSRTLSNIGYCYTKMNNIKSLEYLKKSLKIRLKIKDETGIIDTYFNLSVYFKNINHIIASNYAQIAYEKATKVNSIDARLECLKLLIELSDGSELKVYSQKYITINDSITKARQIAKNQFAKIKYDSKKEKEENLQLKTEKSENELQLQIQKNRILFLSFITITGFLFGFFILYYLKEKNKKEKINTSYTTEIRISKKLHDELANDVYQTMSFAETQDLSSKNNKEALLENLDAIYLRTRNISKENSKIDTSVNYIANLKDMINDFNTEPITILVNGFESLEWSIIDRTKKITLHRVIQELLVNMKKHSQCTIALLTLKKEKNNIYLDYTDNGVGASLKKEILQNGLQNVENRILSIKGRITFDTKPGKGFKVYIQFPI